MKTVVALAVGWLWLAGAVAAQKPATLRLGNGLRAEYFAGPAFQRHVLTRTDPSVSFNWNWQTPGPGVPREYFSVRWTGKLYAPETGLYRFSALVDDGVRVWVGGKKVIDEWRKQDDSEFVGAINLTGGTAYDLRVEYYNDWKGSIVYLYWETPQDRRRRPPYAQSRPDRPIPTQFLYSSADRLPPRAAARPAPRPAPRPAAVEKSVARSVVAGREARPRLRTSPPVALNPGAVAPAEVFTELSPGSTLVLRNVLFEQSSYHLLADSYAELDKLARSLERNPSVRILICGHTDNVGDARLNRLLSENRANVVLTYLVRRGIAPDRLEARGLGGAQPLADNTTESGRAQNRRVEFTVR